MATFLTDIDQFIFELNIPNTDREDVREAINMATYKYEKPLMFEILGYDLAKALYAELDAGEPYEARFERLINGAEYQDANGRTFYWRGLVVDDEGLFKTSLPAHYVYYWFTRNEATLTTGVGEAIGETENAIRTSPKAKQVKAYNDMLAYVVGMVAFIQANIEDYPEYEAAMQQASFTIWWAYDRFFSWEGNVYLWGNTCFHGSFKPINQFNI